MPRLWFLGGVSVALLLSGCGTDYQGTRAAAETSAAARAYDLEDALDHLVADGTAPTGEGLLSLIQDEFPDSPGVVALYRGDVRPDGSVRISAALDGSAFSGGGGTYTDYLARVCVEYRVRGGQHPDVDMSDTRCSDDLLEPTGPTQRADATVTLDDVGGDPRPPSSPENRPCQELSGGDNRCPGD
jgi:hypothetical protein